MATKRPGFLWLAVKIVMSAAILFAAYYWGYIKPRQELPAALIDAEQQLTERYFNLLESRIALTGLTKLDPASVGSNSERQLIFNSLESLTAEGHSLAFAPIEFTPITGAPHSSLQFYNETLPAGVSSLQQRHQDVAEEYTIILTDLLAVEKGIGKLLQYHPRRDLETLDIAADRDTLLARARAAHDGMGAINANVNALPLPNPEQTALTQAITATRTQLTAFIDTLEAGDTAGALKAHGEFIARYPLLRAQAHSVLLSRIRTDEAVRLLTAQTNLIHEYDFWRSRTRQALLDL